MLHILPQIEEIIEQINSVKNQNELIPYLKSDNHVDREDERFYDPEFTLNCPSNSLQVRCFLGQSGYAFRLRAPNYKKFGSKIWLGSKITLYVVRLDIKTHSHTYI